MPYRIVAGPQLHPSTFRRATVGAGWAIGEADRINSAHWRASESAKYGYRRPEPQGQVIHGYFGQKGAPRAVPPVPADLNCIPDFLRRDPPQADMPLAA